MNQLSPQNWSSKAHDPLTSMKSEPLHINNLPELTLDPCCSQPAYQLTSAECVPQSRREPGYI